MDTLHKHNYIVECAVLVIEYNVLLVYKHPMLYVCKHTTIVFPRSATTLQPNLICCTLLWLHGMHDFSTSYTAIEIT